MAELDLETLGDPAAPLGVRIDLSARVRVHGILKCSARGECPQCVILF